MHTSSRLLRAIAWVAIATFGTSNVLATPIALATSPLVSGIGKTVAPNIFFILDDSLSMNSEFMPDAVDDDNDNDGDDDYSDQKRPCTRNFGYNTIYYNPNTTYSPPLNANGTSFANAAGALAVNFNAVKTNGFSTTSSTVDLSKTTDTFTTTAQVTLGNNPFTTSSSGSTPRLVTVTHGALPDGHVLEVGDEVTLSGATGTGSPSRIGNINVGEFSGTFTIQAIVSATQFRITVGGSRSGNGGSGGGSNVKAVYKYKSGVITDYYYYTHATNPSTCGSDGSYTRVPAAGSTWSSMTVAQKTNFANWYSFYRTRLLMMKSASGRAFAGITDNYRVGFTTISETGIGATKFLDIAKFDDTQKGLWYTKLYGTTGASYTPLRGALSKAGRYYAGKFVDSTTGAHDPIQYSCQKNFTILTTDGFWNPNNESPVAPGTGFPPVVSASATDALAPGTAATNYGPFQMDNVTRVGDQDGGLLPPFKDSSSAQNTLADIAYYYYNTDLRPTGSIGGLTDEGTRIDVSTNNVKATNSDPATHQHMTTYTLGLGVDGTLANPGAYAGILAGSTNWPNPITGSGSLQESRRIDDLWHAAVNGRGIGTDGGNMSAKSPDAVVSELSQVLTSLEATVGSSSAAATSNLQPIAGDNTAFIAQYKTVVWTGDLVARTIDVVTGAIPTTNNWSAQERLDTQVSRNIYTYASGSGSQLREFDADNLTPAELNMFRSDSGNPGGALPQWTVLTTTLKGAGPATMSSDATPEAMIDYLRGVRTSENAASWITPTGVFRQREHVLGDIVSAAPVFVRKSPFAYTDPGYATFLSNNANRAPTVYVGANDGMLHAFNGSTGESGSGSERWAYIPRTVLPNLYKLAASDYSLNHRFYVDGPITVGDAYSGTEWGTILVGGLGGGGKGYYALDVTDPANPKALWEFGTTTDFSGDLSYDADMGHSYGNPVITKRGSDGKWVVLFASGYNNTSGDKKGRLYVVDAFTGEKLSEIVTTTTADEELSGIARISNFVVDGLRNNTTQYVYAGDLSGALWRFDINSETVQHLADTHATPGAQPITVQPELARIRAGLTAYNVIYFGTGRYLGQNDLTGPSATVAQAIYAVKDTGTYIGVLSTSGADLVSQTLNSSVSPRTSTSNAVDWSVNNGWYVTTPVGERFNVDPGLQLGTLVIAANIPNSDYCKPTGSSVLYQLSYKSGFVLRTTEFQAQVVGNTQLQLGGSGGDAGVHGGKVVIESVLADGTTINTDQINGGGAAGTATRVSWREIE